MWKSNKYLYSAKLLTFFLALSSHPANADGFLKSDDLKTVVTVCAIENYKVGFCTKKRLNGSHIIFRLPLIKSVLLNDKVHAFRVSATIENMSKRIILNAKLNIRFGTDDTEQLHFIIPQRVIYKDTSSTEISHLIRSDVESMRKLYEKINYIYFNADPTSIDIKPLEINFVKNQ
jgi:hypothetical protein